LNDDEILFEQFTASNIEDFESETVDTNKIDNLWILLWILKFQSRFHLLDTAIDSLIKFIKMILINENCKKFKDFLKNAYMMRNLLKIGK